MSTVTVDDALAAIHIAWPDGEQATYPYIWLRDNCPTAFHPQTRERTLDLLEIPPDIRPKRVEQRDGTLQIDWAGPSHRSRFPLAWLRDHRPGRPAPDPAFVAPQPWRGGVAVHDFPTATAEMLSGDDGALMAWTLAVKRHGLGFVHGLADDPEAGVAVAARIGFLRETNFGRVFEVISKPDPNNLAYTALGLPLHTDLPNQTLVPGFQFLHCVANDAEGGDSVYADGFAIAEDLRRSDPEAFDLLASKRVPMRFHDETTDLRHHAPVIGLDATGALEEVRFNAHIADTFDMPAEDLSAFYRAYRAFIAATRDSAYLLRLRLEPGRMVVFDNRRVLHGRAAFDPASGARHLRGTYVDRGEWDSRIRVLSRRLAEGASG